jgi:hypothetical protein
MLDAMDEVTADTSLPTIGGLAIAAIGSGGMFRYAEHISMGGPTHEYMDSEVREVLQAQCRFAWNLTFSTDAW